MQKSVIVVHGGAGTWQPERRKMGVAGVREAANAGYDVLKRGGCALDAVEVAVRSMEDNEVFNAGLGSTLTIDKRIEMEASIMDGKTLNAGATSLLKDIKNPVHLARIVMENTDHVLVVGEGAERLAEMFHLQRRKPLTEFRLRYWRKIRAKMLKGEIHYLPKLKKLMDSHPHLFDTDTVGAVALDSEGNSAAATSTGGFTLKLPGRIGDSPLIGCGTYADNEAGACSTTGRGEIAIKLVLAKSVCDLMRNGTSAQKAVESCIELVNKRIRLKGSMGLIAVDTRGGVGAAHRSSHMCWAYMTPRMSQPKASVKAKIVSQTS